MSPNNFSDDFNESNPNFEELRQKMETIHDKLEGRNTNEISLADVAQYIRAVNYNFSALSTIMTRILAEHGRIAMTQAVLLGKLDTINKQLKEFFETNSFLDDVLKEKKNDAADSKKD